MARKRAEQSFDSDPNPLGLVPVIFAANKAEAEFYQTLLADADIQTVIDTEAGDRSGQPGKGIAVLVLAELLDEASDIITAREEIEEHILAGPEDQEPDKGEDELTAPSLNDDTVEDEDLLFRRDPFMDEDDRY